MSELDPAAPAAPVTSIAVDPAARESAVQAAMDATKADAAVAQLDAAAKPEPVAPPVAPSHGVPVAVAPAPVEEPEEPVEVAPPVEFEAAPRPLDYDRFEALEARVAELEAHVEDLVNHLAQSFGGEYAAKKARMGV